MSGDLSIQTATTLVTMQAERTQQQVSMKVMKMRLQQDQQLVALLMEQAKQIQEAGYNNSGRSVPPVGGNGIDISA
jgi:hypothetical protein